MWRCPPPSQLGILDLIAWVVVIPLALAGLLVLGLLRLINESSRFVFGFCCPGELH